MSNTTASVVGIPSKTSWSTTATLRLTEGMLWCACGFSGSENAPHEGRRFISYLEKLQGDTPQDVFEKVTEYIQNMNSEIAVSAALGYVVDSKILLFSFGSAAIALQRMSPNGVSEFRWLINGEMESSVLQGTRQIHDTFVFATARFRDTKYPLHTALNQSITDVASELFPRIQGHRFTSEIAVLLVHDAVENKSASSSTSKREVRIDRDIFSQNNLGTHLISPEKIQAGVHAAQVQTAGQRVSPQVSVPIFSHLFGAFRVPKISGINIRQLHIVRITAVFVLVIGIIGAVVMYRAWNVDKEYETVIIPIESLYSELQQDSDIFSQRSTAESLLERVRATRVSYNTNKRRLGEIETDVARLYDQVSGEKEIVNLPVYYDFRLIDSDFLASRMDRESNSAFFLDVNKKQVITLDLETKQNEKIPLDSVESDLLDITSVGSRLYYLTPTNIFSTNLSGSDVQSSVSFDSDVIEPRNIASFGDNLYVLDRGAQQIWRSDSTDSNASPSGWVRSAAGVDFSSIFSFAINGSIWLGSNDGEVYRLTTGTRDSYQFVGLPQAFTSSLLVAANPEGSKLVVAEPSQKRIVIFDKESGAYEQQISAEQIGAITDIVLSEDEKNIYLLSGSVVYKVEM